MTSLFHFNQCLRHFQWTQEWFVASLLEMDKLELWMKLRRRYPETFLLLSSWTHPIVLTDEIQNTWSSCHLP